MSNGKLFGVLSGAQVTVIVLGAMLTPAGLYAAVSSQAVSIVDPNSGASTFVDAGRRAYVYDPIAGLQNNPLYSVKISGVTIGDAFRHTVYTVPAGKALIVKSVDMSYYGGISGHDNYTYFDEATSTGDNSFVAGFDDPNIVGAHNVLLGNGFYILSGETLTYFSSNYGDNHMVTAFSVEGYLVAATQVPAAGTAAAAEQNIQVGGARQK